MKKLPLTLLALISIVSACHAGLYTIDSTTRGWYRNDGAQNPTGNFIVGNFSGSYYRDYFVFDLSAIPINETIGSITLRLANSQFSSADTTETYINFSLDSTTITALSQYHNPSAESILIYDDLGNGTTYSSGTVLSASSLSFIEIPLNAAFVTYAQNSLGDSVALGGALTSLDPNDNSNEFVFGTGGASPSETQLIVTTVPEPSTAVMGIFALIVGLLQGRRTRKTA